MFRTKCIYSFFNYGKAQNKSSKNLMDNALYLVEGITNNAKTILA